MAEAKRHYPELRREDLLEALRQIRHLINFLGGEDILNTMINSHKQTTVFHGDKYLNFVELDRRLRDTANGIKNAEENLRYIISWDMLTNDVLTRFLVNDVLEQKAKEAGINTSDEKAMDNFREFLVDKAREARAKEIREDLQFEKNVRKHCKQANNLAKAFDVDINTDNDNMQKDKAQLEEEAKAKAKAQKEIEKAEKEEAKTAFAQESKEHMIAKCHSLKEWRIRHNLTFYQVGQLIGARYEVVRNIENGNGQSAMQYYQAYLDYVRKNP